MISPSSLPERETARGKRCKLKTITPLDNRAYLPIFFLFLVPGIRYLFMESCESPFTSPDDRTQLNSTIRFVIEPEYPQCTPDHTVVVIVVSRPSEIALRKNIRSSWAHPDVADPKTTKILFIVGRGNSIAEELDILAENREHNDVVMVDIQESYYALSLKTLALLHYKQMRCPQVRCLVKADSDNVLNVRNYELLCEETETDSIVGHCSVSRRVIRNGSKWAVPFDVYPLSRYPQYCSTGTYFLVGHRTVRRLISTVHGSYFFSSANMRKLPEDVLFTGIFAEMADLNRVSIGGLSFFGRPTYVCINGTYRAYGLHMNKIKEAEHFFKILNRYEGLNC